MTGWGPNERLGSALRRGRPRRGVSPIIATILLVAIVVVLASVVYLVVAQFASSGVGATPLGTALAAGPATGSVGTPASNAFCQKSHFCYSIPIQSVARVTLGDLVLHVTLPSGADRIVTTNYARISVVNDRNVALAYTQVGKNSPFVVTSWEHLASGTTTGTLLNSTLTIWVQFGNTVTAPFGQGLSFEMVGTGPFSGVVVVPLA